MAESHQPEKEAKSVPVAEPSAAAAATSSPPVEEEPPTALQPPQHWTDLPVPQDDADSAVGSDAESSTASLASSILRYRTLNGRTYHHESGETAYWGPNDDRQSNTLDIGHHTYTLLMGGKLFLTELPDKIDKVLDIGTGTGIWAMDFGDAHPDATVIGTDISPIQPTWVPPNVSFQIEDFTNDWTFAENTFDFVYMRWLVGCVQDWTAMYKNAFRVLKPGGFIESMEFDGCLGSDDGTVTNTTAVFQWGHIFQEGARKLGSRASFNPIMDGLQRKCLEEAGFINIKETRYKVPCSEWPTDPTLREVGQFTRMALTNDIEGFVTMMATQLGWTTKEISVYAAHLRSELKSLKVHAYFHGCVASAQKPFDV